MNFVYPIRDAALLKEIQQDLETDKTEHGKRMYLLFMTGIYTGLRISDIVGLQVQHVSGRQIVLVEQKTGKKTRIPINSRLRAVYDRLLDGKAPEDYLLLSRQRRPDGSRKPISVRQAEYDCECIKRRYGLDFDFSCHSLRKTFGYWYYKQTGGDLEGLRQTFNHATTDVTRRYIGIDETERNKRISALDMGGFVPQRTKPGRRRAEESEPLEIKRQERGENGKRFGQMLAAKAKKARAARKRAAE